MLVPVLTKPKLKLGTAVRGGGALSAETSGDAAAEGAEEAAEGAEAETETGGAAAPQVLSAPPPRAGPRSVPPRSAPPGSAPPGSAPPRPAHSNTAGSSQRTAQTSPEPSWMAAGRAFLSSCASFPSRLPILSLPAAQGGMFRAAHPMADSRRQGPRRQRQRPRQRCQHRPPPPASATSSGDARDSTTTIIVTLVMEAMRRRRRRHRTRHVRENQACHHSALPCYICHDVPLTIYAPVMLLHDKPAQLGRRSLPRQLYCWKAPLAQGLHCIRGSIG